MLMGLDQGCLLSEEEIEIFIHSDGKGEDFHHLQGYAILLALSGLTDDEMSSVQ